jgi:hypothetical protein
MMMIIVASVIEIFPEKNRIYKRIMPENVPFKRLITYSWNVMDADLVINTYTDNGSITESSYGISFRTS